MSEFSNDDGNDESNSERPDYPPTPPVVHRQNRSLSQKAAHNLAIWVVLPACVGLTVIFTVKVIIEALKVHL